MNKIERIFVVGHPGAGKGLFAKSIAKAIGWQFVDADLGIEHKVGMSLDAIFEKSGKHEYGILQCKIIESLCDKPYIVIATDGGILDTQKAQKLLENEYVVYLNTFTNTQLERSARHPAPLIDDISYQVLFDELHRLRDELFLKICSQKIDGNHSDIDKQVYEVINAIGQIDKPDVKELTSKETSLFHSKTHERVELTEQQALCLKYLVKGLSSKAGSQSQPLFCKEKHISLSATHLCQIF